MGQVHIYFARENLEDQLFLLGNHAPFETVVAAVAAVVAASPCAGVARTARRTLRKSSAVTGATLRRGVLYET